MTEINYSTLQKEPLQELCRERGLPVSGTNAELVERLLHYDKAKAEESDDDLLAAAGQPDGAGEALAKAAGAGDLDKPPPPAPVAVPPERDERLVRANTFEVRYPVYGGELSSGVDLDNIRRALDAAAAAGYQPKGGLGAASRVGMEGSGMNKIAVYHVTVRKRA